MVYLFKVVDLSTVAISPWKKPMIPGEIPMPDTHLSYFKPYFCCKNTSIIGNFFKDRTLFSLTEWILLRIREIIPFFLAQQFSLVKWFEKNYPDLWPFHDCTGSTGGSVGGGTDLALRHRWVGLGHPEEGSCGISKLHSCMHIYIYVYVYVKHIILYSTMIIDHNISLQSPTELWKKIKRST